MVEIKKASIADLQLLLNLGKQTFIESHGNSCAKKDIDSYIAKAFNPSNLKKELADTNNIFHLIFYKKQAVGFSKMIPNVAINEHKKTTKLERIYVLKDYYGKKLGLTLIDFNIALAKKLNQQGMWLYVWTENHRAVNFYLKKGFTIVGKYDFKISKTHSNPNHQMLLLY